MIERYNNCRGLRLSFGKYQIEFWFCPKGEVIPPHTHPNITSYILSLAGKMKWTVAGKSALVAGPFRVKRNGRVGLSGHVVRNTDTHSAEVIGRFGMFVVFEKWVGQGTPVSASIDITHEYKNISDMPERRVDSCNHNGVQDVEGGVSCRRCSRLSQLFEW